MLTGLIVLKLVTFAYAGVLFWLSRKAFREGQPQWGRHYTTLAHIWLVVGALGGLK